MTEPRVAGGLARRLPPRGEATTDQIFNGFLEYVSERNLTLYPAQEDAFLEMLAGKNVILNTPTGSGKSLVASAMHFKAMAEGRRSFYTCPIKALVSEKFFALCQDFGAENVGMMTGDASINRDAPIICCTAEILAAMCLREGHMAPVDYVIMDEFHYYADRDRGVAWQIPLLVLSSATFMLMSATLGSVDFFEREVSKVTGRPTAVIRSVVRPVPLDYTYSETPLHETIAELIAQRKYPIYIVNFTQRACAEEAQNLLSEDWCTKDEKRAIAEALYDVRFNSPYGKEVQKFVRHGVGVHHAGLLPRYRLLVERLAQQGHMKIICGTDTLGVGVNIPIRTVLFTRLCKYDGEKTAILSVRDFHQVAGRAGRKGFDDQGSVVCQAPEHVIENLKAEQKAGDDPAKKRKLVKRKPPEKGYVHWDRATFTRLVNSLPEPLVSRFQVTHGMILSVLQRPGRTHDGCRALARLIRASHGTDVAKRQHGHTAWVLFRSLVDAGVVHLRAGADGKRRYEVNAALQDDFSLHQTLSLYLLEAIEALERESEYYGLDVITLVESVLENPEAILLRQVDKLKTERMAELKAQRVEYEKRIEELEKIEYPKPNKDFIYDTFNLFAAHHPWVGQENIRPKSIAREIFENFWSFDDYVKEYDLERSEGVLLRYLSDAYRSLVQGVPRDARDATVTEAIRYFRDMLRTVDSSLLDEWERMQGLGDDRPPPVPEPPPDITRSPRPFAALVRRAMQHLVRTLAKGDYVMASRLVDVDPGDEPWTAARFDAALTDFWHEHAVMRADHEARSPRNTILTEHPERWQLRQILMDGDEANDWVIEATVDIPRSREAQRPVVIVERIGV